VNPLYGVAIAGGLGAVARFLADRAVVRRYRGLINVSGSLLLGLLTGAVLYHGLGHLSDAVAGTGFCGGYTTFSTFTVEDVRLLMEGRRPTALGYTAGSIVLGLGAAAAGLGLMAL
jgi:CrcB protein